MTNEGCSRTTGDAGKSGIPGGVFPPDTGDERKTIAAGRRRSPQPKLLDAGPFEAEVGSFWLHLAAEGKADRTLHNYAEAVRWLAAAYLLTGTDKTRWEQVDR
jgi:hypothetical protein